MAWQAISKRLAAHGSGSTWLLVGNVFGLGLTAASLIPLAGIYGTEGFGEFGFALSLIQTFGLVSTFRLDLAIPIPKEMDEASSLAMLGALISFVVALAVMGGLMIGRAWIPHELFSAQTVETISAVGFGVFLVGAQQLAIQMGLRRQQLKIVALAYVVQAVVGFAVQWISFEAMGSLGLPFGYLAGIFAANLLLAPLLLRHLAVPDLHRLVMTFRQFFTYAMSSSFSSALSSISNYLPILFFSLFYSSSIAGIFLVAFRLVSMPVDLAGRAVGQIVIAHAGTQIRADKSMSATITTMNHGIWRLSVIPTFAIAIAAPIALPLFFTDQWSDLGVYVVLLAVPAAMQFAAVTLGNIMFINRDHNKVINLQIMLLSMRTAGLFAGLFWGTLLSSVILYSLGSFLAYFVMLNSVFYSCGAKFLDWARTALSELQRLLPVGAACVALRMFVSVDSAVARLALISALLAPLMLVWVRGLKIVAPALEGRKP